MRIRDGKISDPGWKKIQIRDKPRILNTDKNRTKLYRNVRLIIEMKHS